MTDTTQQKQFNRAVLVGLNAFVLTPEETAYLEEPYLPHKLVGVMAQNTPAAAKEQHVWSTGGQTIEP